MIERMTLIDANTIHYTVTIEDLLPSLRGPGPWRFR